MSRVAKRSEMRHTAVFAAMHWECRPVLGSLRRLRRETLGRFTIWRGEVADAPVVVVKTGIGPQLAREAADAALARGECDLVVSTGCAGGLSAHAVPGDLAIASCAVNDATGEQYAADPSSSERAHRVARVAGLTVHRGPIVCVADAYTTRAAKHAAAARGQVAVEMEGAAIAASAAAAGIPYLSVRAILDDAETELHDGGFVDGATGRVKPIALVKYVARRPAAVGELRSMQRMMQAAEDSLAAFFRTWFSLDRG